MNKPAIRLIALILVTLLVLGMFSGVFAIFAVADDMAVSQEILTADTTLSPSPLTVGKFKENVTIKFRFKSDIFEISTDYTLDDFSIPASASFGMSTKSTLKVTDEGKYFQVELRNILYNGGGTKALELYIDDSFYFYVPLANKFFRESSSSETDEAPTSDIVVQSVVTKNAAGHKISEINKKTEPFSIEVTFYDVGLRNESNGSIDAAKKYIYITTQAGFKLHAGANGKIERLTSSADYPRFRATFEKIQVDETSNTLGFRVQYDFEEYEKGVKGESTATVHQIKPETDEDDDEIAPLKPNLIVQEYSYGEEAIVAGSEFDLAVTFANTSKEVRVENVVMTIEPGNGFLIAAASNTMYFPNMSPGESKPYAIGLKALPSQDTTGSNPIITDYSVTIKFSYQYLSKKEYAAGETSVKIAIPVEQLDRFTVDEITDYTQYTMVGGEAYVSVPITNKGKSATMNISGSARSLSGGEFVAADVHYGNLEAGKSASLDVNLTINTPGEFQGEIIVSYEDENMNQKQITAPFSIMVQEPPPPPPEVPVDPEADQNVQPKMHPLSIALCATGGLMVASPVALGLMKRIKARGSEDFDEDF